LSEKNRKRRRFSPGEWAIQRERFQIGPELPPHLQSDAVPLDEIVDQLLDHWGLDSAHWIDQLAHTWETVAGKQVAAHARPGHLDQDILTIYVNGSVWLHELKRYAAGTLLKNIQKAMGTGKVRKLNFVLDPDGGKHHE
jgi:predicted nucleic acid-binding Zn ribbon protein